MSKQFHQPKDGKFCLQVEGFFNSMDFNYEVLNLDENTVKASGRAIKLETQFRQHFVNRVDIEHLQTGQYKLTLQNITNDIFQIKPCHGIYN